MELQGLLIIHIDVDPDVAHEYHRWYDLDHGPEAIWQPGVMGTRRYRASPDLVAQRVASQLPELGDGPGELLSLYWLGGGEDPLVTRSGISAYLGPEGPVAKEGRLFRRDKVRIRNAEAFRRVGLHGGDSPVALEAIPYLGHLGVYLEVWKGHGIGPWLEAEHAPRLVEMPAVLGALHLEGAVSGHADWQVLVALLGEEPAQAAAHLREQLAGGSNASHRLFGGCFELITPLRYDFARQTST